MTRMEKLVWAAAFADALARMNGDAQRASGHADAAVVGLRAAALRFSEYVQPSDITERHP